MATLIACLSSGKGTWNEVRKLIQIGNWNKVFLVTHKFGLDNFGTKPENAQFIVLENIFLETSLLVEQIKKQLNGKISDFEIALNICSGSGNEHMALLEAILELGLNFRLVTLDQNEQMKVLGLE